MKPLSRRERILMGLMALVVLVIGLPAFFGGPPGARGPSLAQERRKRRDLEARLARARAEVDTLRGDIDGSLSDSTPRQLVQGMVGAAQAAARTAGVRLEDLKPMPLEKTGTLQAVPLRVSLSARFPQAVRFIYELERRTGRAGVDQLRMDATSPQNDHLKIELRLVGYVKGEQEGDDGRLDARG